MSFKFLKHLRKINLLHLKSVFLSKMLSTMKISDVQVKSILNPGSITLSNIFIHHGFELRLVGGAVRDLLMGVIPKDLDFCTNATVSEIEKMFTVEEVRIIRIIEASQTVVTRIDEENFECNSIYTSGKKENEECNETEPWEWNAKHRDFTINALFMGFDGVIYDYVNGIDHLNKRKVVFVGNPNERIQENYIRILRYFRFFGQVARTPFEHDSAAIDAIQKNCEGLFSYAKEPLWDELKKILRGKFGCELFIKIVECGVAQNIGFPNDFDCENFQRIFKRLSTGDNVDVNPCTILAAGFMNADDALNFTQTLKCSKKETEILSMIIKHQHLTSEISLKTIQHIMVDMIYKERKDKKLVIETSLEFVNYCGRTDLLEEVNNQLIPHFPITGGQLVGKVKKKLIAVEMKKLLNLWKESDYSLTGEELLNKL